MNARPLRAAGRLAWLAAGGAVVLAYLASGGVLAGIVAVYAGLGVRVWRRRQHSAASSVSRQRVLDAVRDLAADLRAGRPAAPAMVEAVAALDAQSGPLRDVVARRLAAAWQLADSIGVPLADLLERLDAELRAAETARLAAAAETAGARATGLLVAALPLGALPVGATLGVDPVDTLLHTGLGAACAGAAVVLQCAGLAWTGRLARGAAS
jgi:tight adherence protein B